MILKLFVVVSLLISSSQQTQRPNDVNYDEGTNLEVKTAANTPQSKETTKTDSSKILLISLNSSTEKLETKNHSEKVKSVLFTSFVFVFLTYLIA
ncbi:hypothetical protein PVAND_007396 [Polypedilum vanderplanki]|uniref:Uncharacterized protein n=1 Tax=Polypedilum vanderplanki TaxID=319348 RepID=A0A9J6C6D9_POLVA|nr:hypothetical protein PVAND_007396 [Polypedilum vanderplanki]